MKQGSPLRISAAAKQLGLLVEDLLVKIQEGEIKTETVILKRRKEIRVPVTEITEYKKKQGQKIACYACVPISRQEDLSRHVQELTSWVTTNHPGEAYEVISELGIPSNEDRRVFSALLNEVRRYKYYMLVCCYRDCLFFGPTRFLEALLEDHGCLLAILHPAESYSQPTDYASAIDRHYLSRVEPNSERRKPLRRRIRKSISDWTKPKTNDQAPEVADGESAEAKSVPKLRKSKKAPPSPD